jgi:hypothetical protein
MAKKLPPDAFDHYFSLGPQRSYQALAVHFGASKRAVTALAKREQWQERIQDLERKAREASDKKKLESLEERNERHLTALRFIQARAIEALKKMPIDAAMDAVRAYNMSLRDERVILGDPTDRTALTVEDTIKREYERWMVSAEPQDGNGSEREGCNMEEEVDDVEDDSPGENPQQARPLP